MFDRLIFFRLVCSAHLARPGPPLSPILGQHQVKVTEFINLFDQLTVDYLEGVPLLCRIKKYTGSNKFNLQIKLSTWTILFGGSLKRLIPVNYLYDVFIFYGLVNPIQVRYLIGVMRSSKFKPF